MSQASKRGDSFKSASKENRQSIESLRKAKSRAQRLCLIVWSVLLIKTLMRLMRVRLVLCCDNFVFEFCCQLAIAEPEISRDNREEEIRQRKDKRRGHQFI